MEKKKSEIIVLGGGCFWCSEAVFLMIAGVIKAMPGYAGGPSDNPRYEQVFTGRTGHAEVVQVEYNPHQISLKKILEIFFSMHDPTSLNRQGNDVGTQYRSIILWTGEKQKKLIELFVSRAQKEYTQPIVTEIKKLEKFYPAEEYHHRYFEKHPEKSYCAFVIAPKVKKVKNKFLNAAKTDANSAN